MTLNRSESKSDSSNISCGLGEIRRITIKKLIMLLLFIHYRHYTNQGIVPTERSINSLKITYQAQLIFY